mgnify:CR=1 FL=1
MVIGHRNLRIKQNQVIIMKKKVFLAVSFLVGLVILAGVLWKVGLTNILQILSDIRFDALFYYVIASIIIFLGYTYRWDRILKAHGHKESFVNLFFYKTAGYGVSYITPSAKLGGEPLRAYLLCRNNAKFDDAFSATVLDKAMELTANGLFTVLGVFYVLASFAVPSSGKTILYIVAAVWAIGILIFYLRTLRGKGFFTSAFRLLRLNKIKFVAKYEKPLLDGEQKIHTFFNKNKKEFIISLIISLMLWLGMLIEFKFLFMAFGYPDITFVQIFLVTFVVGVAYVFPIPAALGVLEVGQESLFRILLHSTGTGLMISLITRVRDSLWTIVGLTYLYMKGINFLKGKFGD